MSNKSFVLVQDGEPRNWDLFRLSKAKAEVDICANTLRQYHEAGLPFYRRGRAVFVSKTELKAFIRSRVDEGVTSSGKERP